MNKQDVLLQVDKLIKLYNEGVLGGENMPEQENPALDIGSKENYLYFTLPMALNYQRNSYVLWECANRLYAKHPELFDCGTVVKISDNKLREILVEYKVALQPNKQPIIWKTLCRTFNNDFNGDVRLFFQKMDYKVENIEKYILEHKKDFPYLGGNKIRNYWLYVMEQYTDAKFVDRENISVAPDTHVVQASERLGVITKEELSLSNVQLLVAERWKEILSETDYDPIDIHTPMRLWSRGKFQIEV